MIPRARRDAGDAIVALLQEQRSALREGRLKDLAAMVPVLERALGKLNSHGDLRAQSALRCLARENADLLRAALQGLAQVRDMRSSQGKAALSTYNAAGHRQAQGAAPSRTLSRR